LVNKNKNKLNINGARAVNHSTFLVEKLRNIPNNTTKWQWSLTTINWKLINEIIHFKVNFKKKVD